MTREDAQILSSIALWVVLPGVTVLSVGVLIGWFIWG